MSNLEHLLENGLSRLDEGKSYREWREIMQQDVNWENNENITLDNLWEICQYVIYTWCEGITWVKCSDRMPEEHDTIFAKFKGTNKWKSAMFEKMSEDVRVVVVFEDGTRKVHHSYTVDGKWDVEKKQPKRTVTHWMPNPELPDD